MEGVSPFWLMALEERSRNEWAGEIPSSVLYAASVPFLTDFLFSFACWGTEGEGLEHDSSPAKALNGPATAVLSPGQSPVHGARILGVRGTVA